MNYIEHINHTELTGPAHAHLVKYLEGFGNVLSVDHSNALRGLLSLMTDMARGKHTGRYAAGLDTGLGKSSAILIWIASLQVLPGGHNLAVSVAAQRIESLCELKRGLVELGVPEDMIGLVHTYKHWTGDQADIPAGYASEPANVEADGSFSDRPIMLVSHTRVRGTKDSFEKTQPFSHYNGKPRALMLFDESLLIAEARMLNLQSFGAAVGLLRGLAPPFGNNSHVPMVLPWLAEVEEFLKKAMTCAKGPGHKLVRLPTLPAQTESLLKTLSNPHGGLSPQEQSILKPVVTTLLELVPYDLRLTSRHGRGGLLTFEIVVPEELGNIIILDASYPIRQLMHEDSSIKDAEPVMVEGGMELSKPLAQLKDYSDVTWHQMQAAGGRTSMDKEFKCSKREAPRAPEDVADVVRAIPGDEAVLIFVYKQRGRQGADFKADILAVLESHGIDTDATVKVEVPGGTESRQRINIATWGNETGANAWAHCQHVVMVGILQKDRNLLEGLYAGQHNNLDVRVDNTKLYDVIDSESAHLAHQAASRSVMRHVTNGKARAAHVWVIHNRAKELRKHVSKVQADAVWVDWKGAYGQSRCNKTSGLATRVVDYMLKVPEGTDRLSVRKVKADLKLVKVANRTWQLARDAAMEDLTFAWQIEGAWMVRVPE